MNKLDQMNIANLTSQEVDELKKYEKEINNLHENDEIYLLALRK